MLESQSKGIYPRHAKAVSSRSTIYTVIITFNGVRDIDFTVQRVCREACEKLKSEHCEPEFEKADHLNRNGTHTFHIINCTDLPSRKESSICYDPANRTEG